MAVWAVRTVTSSSQAPEESVVCTFRHHLYLEYETKYMLWVVVMWTGFFVCFSVRMAPAYSSCKYLRWPTPVASYRLDNVVGAGNVPQSLAVVPRRAKLFSGCAWRNIRVMWQALDPVPLGMRPAKCWDATRSLLPIQKEDAWFSRLRFVGR